ncbi:hypothetical protein CPC08DRAFT_98165 [Agrocybe pediades]|nr:hypothetical protein CPC08DRAFT_98165 [Agrocybe pediades]
MDYFLDFVVFHDKQIDIKEEAPEPVFSLLSPPITPSLPSFTLPSVPSTTTRRRGSTSLLAGSNKRPRPYPAINREISSRKSELGIMSNNMSYGTWNPSGVRSPQGRHAPVQRKSSDEEGQTDYALQSQFMNGPYLPNPDMRPMSSSSSLTGAMGDATISQSRHSRSPTSSNSGYTGNLSTHDPSWDTAQMMLMPATNNNHYPAVPGHGGMAFSGMNQPHLDMMNEYTTTRNVSPESLSPHSPNQNYYSDGGYGAHNIRGVPTQQGGGYPGSHLGAYTSSPGDSTNDLARLQRRIRELEQENERYKMAMQAKSGLPSAPQSAAFQASWRARTDARVKLFCSLNRAGNALCAWHDSRRERRVYPPRNAPPGYLNCGCTFEEALFEESLARHGVGSYLPGDSVRMDPALRNPLLKLLQQRFGYKDGDFDHDPFTETWHEGEGPAHWEQRLKSGQPPRKRQDSDKH